MRSLFADNLAIGIRMVWYYDLIIGYTKVVGSVCTVFLWVCSERILLLVVFTKCWSKAVVSCIQTTFFYIPFCTRILKFRWPRLKTVWSQILQSIVNWRKSVSVEKCVCVCVCIILICRSQRNCFCVLRLAFKSSTWQADFHEFQASQGLRSEPLSLLPHPRDKRYRSSVAIYK